MAEKKRGRPPGSGNKPKAGPMPSMGAAAKLAESRKYYSAKELEQIANAYFEACDEKNVLYGEAGLALGLGLTLRELREMYDGKRGEAFQTVIQRAYLCIQNQIETSPAYREKGGMATKAIFLLKQPRLGGYQDKIEARNDMTVNVKMGAGVDESDFK